MDHVIVVGGGIAGLGAAWELRRRGVRVTLIERAGQAGGRCRSVHWRGRWIVTGAFAFNGSDINLIQLANEIGIYNRDDLIDMTAAHIERIWCRRRTCIELRSFTTKEMLTLKGIPVRERLALARALPPSLRRWWHLRRGRLTAAECVGDDVAACDFFRRSSPSFVDYVLEPTMQMFCGWGPEDYSLGFLLEGLGTGSSSWWTFAQRGVGQLTHTLHGRLAHDNGCEVRLETTADQVRCGPTGVEVDVRGALGGETLHAGGLIVTVPGTQVLRLMPTLDEERAAFFRSVRYVPHHLVYYLVDGDLGDVPGAPSPDGSLGLLLPTADGFRMVSNVHWAKTPDGPTLVYAETKGKESFTMRAASADQVLDRAWADICEVARGTSGVRVLDRYLSRNEEALCARPIGYGRRLARFKSLPPLARVRFAGDTFTLCTVGNAHQSGVAAAKDLLNELQRS